MTKGVPSIRDVADAAGVSTATVSRALSNPGVVTETTRRAVFDAIEQTGYTVNVAARNLRRRETGGVVVLVPNLGNAFFSLILAGIAEVMAEADLNVLIADTAPGVNDERQILDYLGNHRADGLIVLDGMLSADLLLDRGDPRTRAPLVFACEWVEDLVRPAVTIDNVAAARLAVRHLVDLGHRDIGHLAGPPGNVLTATRRAGAEQCLAEAGLDLRDDWFIDGDFSLRSGAAAAERWMALRHRPTALFCASDQMACGFIAALHRAGYSVPRDVSVVGFDDIEFAAHFVPPLTTIHQPRVEIGRTAARMLLRRMEARRMERPDPETTSETLPVRLVVRDSTRRVSV
ncbi:LacI family DNA-binding transcriptional regulator [Psychromarinibacter sp. C21-152]|uniref:LacI family DNA-binding transcriptional regulator n=1 Tax=Psychromarinibacter sediminicola TaxID=3033385 RepID=A0AAE3TAT8_9RHOB|nr:LacI family DNA-binding transcriptional regulator [Psychromarinibacter sediminicola]MDF0601960.1 LacI family DNA-binding transcriptional regulator [Psychromarinibacter sediminicola]